MSKTARDVIADYLGDTGDGNGLSAMGPFDSSNIIECLDAAGFVIVPKEPTKKMLDAGYGFCGEETGSDKPATDFYRAMIGAAP